MAKGIKDSRTEKNILAAFNNESQRSIRYMKYATKAKEEGFIQISSIFEETSNQEKEHSKRFFNFLDKQYHEIVGSKNVGSIGSTLDNLKIGAAGEKEEWEDTYPYFSQVAREEGFDEIADAFDAILVAEKQHCRRFRDLAENVESGSVFKRDIPVVWFCRNCGFLHEAAEAPKNCPGCLHNRAFFELLNENW